MVNIFILIKQVPSIHNLEIDKKTGALIREGIETIINPDDLYALELGLELKEKYGGKITAVTMGPPQAEIALRECLAMGLDEAIHICDPIFAYSDTLQTTLVLKEVFDKIKDYELIITGSQTSDSSTGQVPYQLSEALNIPLITDIFTIELKNGIVECHRNFGHESQKIQVELPILLRVRKHFNEPRHLSLLGIKKAFEKEIIKMDFNTLNCPNFIDGCNKSPTKVVKTAKISLQRKNKIIEGTTGDKIQKILEIIQEHGIEKIWVGEK